jgi:hypothetical protein
MKIKKHVFVGEGRKLNKAAMKGAVLCFLLLFSIMLFSSGVHAQYSQKNVTSRVNVTNAAPDIINMSVLNPIVLNGGAERVIGCNVSVRDYNGYNDLDTVNATFYYFANLSSPDDKNVHYTNTNCTKTGDDGVYVADYTCEFNVSYMAYNGTWYCNFTVNDTRSYVENDFRATNISALYAINVTDVIDYGDLSVTDYSNNITATVTNLGNVNINISVLGYGSVQGDGLGFVCTQGTNISVQYERFSSNILADWSSKIPLNTTNKDMNLTILRQENDIVRVSADTYWQLYVPPNPFGICTGIVRFTATAP